MASGGDIHAIDNAVVSQKILPRLQEALE